MTQPAETSLLALAVAGDADAFRGLLRGALGDVYRFCGDYTADGLEAERVTGLAFRLAAEELASIPVGATFRGWVFRQAWRELGASDGRLAGVGPLRELRQRYGFGGADLASILGVGGASGETLARRLGEPANGGGEEVPLVAGLDVRVQREAFRGWPPREARAPAALTGGVAAEGGRRRWLAIGGPMLAAAAGLLVVLLVAPRSPIALTGSDDGGGTRPAAAVATSTPGATATGTRSATATRTATGTATARAATASVGASATPTPSTASTSTNVSPSPTATSTGTGTPTPAPTATPTATTTPTPTVTPSATPTPCVPRITVNVDSPPGVTLIKGDRAFFEVRTSCGTASIDVANSAPAWLSASAMAPSVTFPGAVRVTLLASNPAIDGDSAVVAVQGPNNSVTVSVVVVAP